MNSVYSVFGLTLRSNVPIAALLLSPSPSAPDIDVQFGISPVSAGFISSEHEESFYASADLNPSGEPLVRIWRNSGGSLFRVEFDEGAQFWLSRDARNVWAVWRPPLSLDDAVSYLLGPVIGLLLRLRGVVCLHASAISLDGRAIAFVGPEGAGKSTTAAAFAARGHAILSDDIVALIEREQAFHVLPAWPHLSLWPDSVDAIFGSPDAAPRFSATYEKRRLPLGNPSLPFETRALPLSSIFLLGSRSADPPPRAELLSPREALLALVANSYASNALESEARAKELAILGRLVAALPVRSLNPHSDPSRLSGLCEFVCRIAREAPAQAGAASSH